jgi:hypothetical protein
MSLTQTSLAAACGASDLQLAITSTSTGFPVIGSNAENQLMQIDGEFMYIVGVPASGYVTVRGRGSEGTAAVAHDKLAPVLTSSAVSDWPATPTGSVTPRPVFADDIVTLGQNGVIAVPIKDTIVNITKATALSSTTLAAPSTASNGVQLTLTSQTAAAHVITATSLVGDAVSGSPHTTMTFAAYIGATITLIAQNGIWNVKSSTGVTVT